jgi:hypothetical protein
VFQNLNLALPKIELQRNWTDLAVGLPFDASWNAKRRTNFITTQATNKHLLNPDDSGN